MMKILSPIIFFLLSRVDLLLQFLNALSPHVSSMLNELVISYATLDLQQ